MQVVDYLLNEFSYAFHLFFFIIFSNLMVNGVLHC